GSAPRQRAGHPVGAGASSRASRRGQILCIRGGLKLGLGSSTLRDGAGILADSIRVSHAVLKLAATARPVSGGTMQPFRADGNGWPSSLYSLSSSHYARHQLSRRAFVGGAAAAAAGASLGSGLLWPAAGSAAAISGRAPKPTTNAVVIEG